MKKILLLALAAVVVAALVPAQAEARHTLAHKVKILEAKMKCITRTPVTQFGTPAGDEFGYLWDNTDDDTGDLIAEFGTSAIDVDFGNNTPDFWIAAIKPTSFCKGTFARTPTPVWWPLRASSPRAPLTKMARLR